MQALKMASPRSVKIGLPGLLDQFLDSPIQRHAEWLLLEWTISVRPRQNIGLEIRPRLREKARIG